MPCLLPLLLLSLLPLVRLEAFSSTAHLKQLVSAEKDMTEVLRGYVDDEIQRLETINQWVLHSCKFYQSTKAENAYVNNCSLWGIQCAENTSIMVDIPLISDCLQPTLTKDCSFSQYFFIHYKKDKYQGCTVFPSQFDYHLGSCNFWRQLHWQLPRASY